MPRNSTLKEPLVHFMIAGAGLFGVYSIVNHDVTESGEATADRIVIGTAEIRAIESRWENQWGREPTATELTDLVNDYIREEALYRRAVAMELDAGDTIVRRRMAQKLTFLIEGMATEQSPSESTLRKWFEENQSQYLLPATVTFRHVYFSADRRHGKATEDAQALLAQLDGLEENAGIIGEAGDRFMLKDTYDTIARQELAHLFGTEFVDAVFGSPPGKWSGPISSEFGEHLVYVRQIEEARIAEFEQVANRVAADWTRNQVKEANDTAIEEILSQYRIDLDSSVAGQLEQDRILGGDTTR